MVKNVNLKYQTAKFVCVQLGWFRSFDLEQAFSSGFRSPTTFFHQHFIQIKVITIIKYISSCSQVFCEIGVLKNSQESGPVTLGCVRLRSYSRLV